MSELTFDAISGLGVKLHQPRSGHRVGADAVLLAASAGPAVSTLVDVGAGVGAVGLALARRFAAAKVKLIEIDERLAGIAVLNSAENGLSERVGIVIADVLDREARRAGGVEDGKADLIVTNPPFYDSAAVRVSPDAAKARAHAFEGEDGLADWIIASLALLRPGGRFVLIHRPERLKALLDAFGKRLGDVAIRPVFPRDGEDAIRVLISGVKGSRAPMRMRPALVLHDKGGFTPQAAAIHRGEALLD